MDMDGHMRQMVSASQRAKGNSLRVGIRKADLSHYQMDKTKRGHLHKKEKAIKAKRMEEFRKKAENEIPLFDDFPEKESE